MLKKKRIAVLAGVILLALAPWKAEAACNAPNGTAYTLSVTASANPNPACVSDPVSFSYVATTSDGAHLPPAVVQWTPYSDNPHTFDQPGIYTNWVIVKNPADDYPPGPCAASNSVVVTVLKVEIKKPTGNPDFTNNTSSAWLTSPCYHWDFQGVCTNCPANYALDVEGEILPAIFNYGWTTETATAVGTLSGTGATPTHNPSATASEGGTEGTFKLEAMDGTNATGCKDQTNVVIYLDHLARDYKNFGTNQSCKAGSWSTPFGPITMSEWNCMGSVNHAYNGTGNGFASYPNVVFTNWSSNTYAYPFSTSATNAINAMSRGDVVEYWSTWPVPGHAATSLGGATTWGANNEPIGSATNETYMWHVTTVFDYAADISSNWPRLYGRNFTNIVIRGKP